MPTTLVQGSPVAGLTPADFADIGVCTLTLHPNGVDLIMDFEADLTEQQQTDALERSRGPVEQRDLREAARTAVLNNEAWVTNVYPQIVSGAEAIIDDTTATARERQLAQGVRSLANQLRDVSVQNNGVIRLVVRAVT